MNYYYGVINEITGEELEIVLDGVSSRSEEYSMLRRLVESLNAEHRPGDHVNECHDGQVQRYAIVSKQQGSVAPGN